MPCLVILPSEARLSLQPSKNVRPAPATTSISPPTPRTTIYDSATPERGHTPDYTSPHITYEGLTGGPARGRAGLEGAEYSKAQHITPSSTLSHDFHGQNSAHRRPSTTP